MRLVKVFLVLVASFVLMILPLSATFIALMPSCALLMVLAFSFARPKSMNVGLAWVVGLIMDSLTGSLLGLHAMSYVIVVYLCVLFYQRIRMFHLLQQSMVVGCLVLMNNLLLVCLESMLTNQETYSYHLLSVLTTALCWPFASLAADKFMTPSRQQSHWGSE